MKRACAKICRAVVSGTPPRGCTGWQARRRPPNVACADPTCLLHGVCYLPRCPQGWSGFGACTGENASRALPCAQPVSNVLRGSIVCCASLGPQAQAARGNRLVQHTEGLRPHVVLEGAECIVEAASLLRRLLRARHAIAYARPICSACPSCSIQMASRQAPGSTLRAPFPATFVTACDIRRGKCFLW